MIDRGSHWHHHCLTDQLDQLLEITPSPVRRQSARSPPSTRGQSKPDHQSDHRTTETANSRASRGGQPNATTRENWSAFRHPRPTGSPSCSRNCNLAMPTSPQAFHSLAYSAAIANTWNSSDQPEPAQRKTWDGWLQPCWNWARPPQC